MAIGLGLSTMMWNKQAPLKIAGAAAAAKSGDDFVDLGPPGPQLPAAARLDNRNAPPSPRPTNPVTATGGTARDIVEHLRRSAERVPGNWRDFITTLKNSRRVMGAFAALIALISMIATYVVTGKSVSIAWLLGCRPCMWGWS